MKKIKSFTFDERLKQLDALSSNEARELRGGIKSDPTRVPITTPPTISLPPITTPPTVNGPGTTLPIGIPIKTTSTE